MTGTAIAIPSKSTEIKPEAASFLENTATVVSQSAKATALGALDVAASITERLDSILMLPKTIASLSKYIPIPLSKEIGESVGTIFSAAFYGLFHAGTVGTCKWLQLFRRQTAIDSTLNEVAKPGDTLSMSLKGYISRIEDPTLRESFKDYATLVTKQARIAEDTSLSEETRRQESQVLSQDIARHEIALRRYGELTEIKNLLRAPDKAGLASEAELHYLATSMADTMIERIEGFYKTNAGFIASEVTGEWTSLAAQGAAGREALIDKIEKHLMKAYLAERNGESAKAIYGEMRSDLCDAFKTNTLFNEAILYTTLGILSYTGLLPLCINKTIEGLGVAGGYIGHAFNAIAPEWLTNAFSNAFGYAEAIGATVLGYLGIKSVATIGEAAKSIREGFGGRSGETSHLSSDARVADTSTAIRTDAGARVDGGAPLDALKAQLKSLTRSIDGATARMGEISAATHQSTVAVDTGQAIHTQTPHMDVRTAVQETRIDPSLKVEALKVTPR
jgi:hypothetical protein